MRVCVVYDCLFPWTVGGAERWYRALAERLVVEGHDVTYLTRRQWEDGDAPALPGIRVVAVSGAGELYGPDGGRRVGPPLAFGAGVLAHLARHGRDYDVVHTASFPYFSLLAAGLARRRGGYALMVDWLEVWSAAYWRAYLGPVGGRVGLAVQRLCARVPQHAFTFSRRFERRLVAEGLRGRPVVLPGLYDGPTSPQRSHARTAPLVLVAGRQIPEKRTVAAIAAIARLRERGLDLRGLVIGDGPEHAAVLEAIAAHDLQDVVDAPGFVDRERVDEAMAQATCLLHPSSREGYGMVVVEAASHGTPVVLVDGEDNAAVELIEPDVNGVVAPTDGPDDLARAVERVHAGGAALRERTSVWFAERATGISVQASLERVLAAYAAARPSARR
jgi:glycosyltransferase involved in cell wall biosynthesis